MKTVYEFLLALSDAFASQAQRPSIKAVINQHKDPLSQPLNHEVLEDPVRCLPTVYWALMRGPDSRLIRTHMENFRVFINSVGALAKEEEETGEYVRFLKEKGFSARGLAKSETQRERLERLYSRFVDAVPGGFGGFGQDAARGQQHFVGPNCRCVLKDLPVSDVELRLLSTLCENLSEPDDMKASDKAETKNDRPPMVSLRTERINSTLPWHERVAAISVKVDPVKFGGKL